MEPLFFLLFIPLLGSAVFSVYGSRNIACEINVGCSLAALMAAIALAIRTIDQGAFFAYEKLLYVDAFNVFLIVLTSFVGFTTSVYSRPYMRIETDKGRMTPKRIRLYHSMYQLFMFTMFLALATNNIGILWVAMEGATLATVLLVSVYRTATSLEAAWKYFILCGVGIALALFGTILIFLAAERQLGGGGNALLWTNLNAVKSQLEPAIISLAFIFLLIGYGSKMGLVPLHSWLPDAHAEGPTPISAVLSGLLLNIAVYAVLRFKVIADGALNNGIPGKLLVGFGLLSVLVASFSLSRQKDVKRMFSYSSIEHVGLMTFAFGMGGALATYAGLFHLTLHSLVKSAIFFTVGHACQKAGSQAMADIRGLVKVNPVVGWGLLLGALAILGMPPFGVFASEFLMITSAMQILPWAVPIILISLGVAFATIFSRAQSMAFGETSVAQLSHTPALAPIYVHYGLAIFLGLYVPPYLNEWLKLAVKLIIG
ncbi:MAG: hydrogenase 4 subunit F [Burkholderiales bacterium]|nr:hydrogenase 4 subunit F [Burkholderiales bacterium]